MSRAGLALLAVLLAPGAAGAGETLSARPPWESSRDWIFEFNGGRFRPNMAEPGLSGDPYREVFGAKRMWLFEGELDYHLWQGFGTLSAGLAAGYGVVYGHGIVARTDESARDLTALKTVPLRALAVYRFDWLDRRFGIPLVPFGKAGLAHTLWWVTDGNGEVARFGEDRAFGGKWGYQLAAGLGLSLSFFDPILDREFDADFGVNSVFLHAQYAILTADNLGGAGIDLSDSTWLFGLGFEF